MDSVPTLLITVSLETERGLPPALGNLPGPDAERVQRRKKGRGQRTGREEVKEGLSGILSFVHSFGYTSLHSHHR